LAAGAVDIEQQQRFPVVLVAAAALAARVLLVLLGRGATAATVVQLHPAAAVGARLQTALMHPQPVQAALVAQGFHLQFLDRLFLMLAAVGVEVPLLAVLAA
jgi:hypothetical protein